MIIFLFIVVIVIAIIVLSIKYFRTYAKLVSHKSYDKEAKRRAAELKHTDPVISCDYCGAKIDTRIQKVCPQCGANYDADKEWKARHNPDYKWADENAEDNYKKELTDAEKKAQKIATHLKIWISALAGCAILLTIIGVLAMCYERYSNYAKSEKVNRFTYDNYAPVDYKVEGDGVIYDMNGVKVTVTGFYLNDGYLHDSVKIEYKIENTNSKRKRILLETGFVNGFDVNSLYYEWIRKNDVVYHYEAVYADDNPVKEVVFTRFKVEDEEYGSSSDYENKDLVYITTTADYEVNPSFDGQEVLFDNDYMTIYYDEIETKDNTRGNIYFDIKNKSDMEWLVDGGDTILVNGEKDEVNTSLYKRRLIPKGALADEYLSSAWNGQDLGSLNSDDSLEFSLSFSCVENPSLDFSTGYIKINKGATEE